MKRLLSTYALLALLLGASPAPATTWQGVTLGEPSSAIRSSLGDPLHVVTLRDGRPSARYSMKGADGIVFVVIERGYVTEIETSLVAPPNDEVAVGEPDPNGVRLGDALANVAARHLQTTPATIDKDNRMLSGRVSSTITYAYRFSLDGRVSTIQWETAIRKDLPDLGPIIPPAGVSPGTAILVRQNNEKDGVTWEYSYLEFHPCDGSTAWRLTRQALLRDGPRSYDRLHVMCPTSKVERDFYFDITPYFGTL